METFLEREIMCREPPPGHVFTGSLAEIDPRKVAEVVRRSRDIRSLQYTAIRSAIRSPIMNRVSSIYKHLRSLSVKLKGKLDQA